MCTAVLPGAHELARGKGAWSSVLQGWLAVWVGGERCVRVGPADGCEESDGGAVWGGEAAGRAEPVRAAPAAVVSPRKLSLLVGRLPTPPPALGVSFLFGHVLGTSLYPRIPSLSPDPLSIPKVPSRSLGSPPPPGYFFPTLPPRCPLGLRFPHPSLSLLLQSSLMDLADVFTAPAAPPATDPWGAPVSMAAALPTAAPASDPWGGPPVPQAADPWGGPAPTPASGDPWRPAAPAGPPADPWGGTQAPAAGEGPAPDPWGGSDGENPCPQCVALGVGDW